MSDTTEEVRLYWQKLHGLYGDVKRARGPFLYTQSGVRLTDLYQDAGRAILGWSTGGALTAMKRAIERGAVGFYLTAFRYRLEKAVNALFCLESTPTPHKRHSTEESPEQSAMHETDQMSPAHSAACEAAAGASTQDGAKVSHKAAHPWLGVMAFASEADCLEQARAITGRDAVLWRPWVDDVRSVWQDECVAFSPPLPWGEGVFAVAASEAALSRCTKDVSLCAITLPPPVEAAAARAIYDLILALSSRCEQQWFLYDCLIGGYWRREGPYLYPKVARETYPAFAEHCLKQGIVVNPSFEGASIVPFGAKRGVFATLKKNPFAF